MNSLKLSVIKKCIQEQKTSTVKNRFSVIYRLQKRSGDTSRPYSTFTNSV